MSKLQRVRSFLSGILYLAFGMLLFLLSDGGYLIVVMAMGVGLFFTGVSEIAYFFTMARFMVGGRQSLYRGVLILNLAVFTLSLADVPKIYVLLYLFGIHGFSGLVDVLRSLEAKKMGANAWRLKFSHGVINLLLAAACLIFIKTPATAVYIYAIGLMYSALMRMITAFRRTAIVYIP